MILTDKQQKGLEIAVDRYNANEKYTVLAGYAGTGKSTLVQHIIAALNLKSEDVVYCAYTGKATLVLSQKGCKNTSTLHKLLYKTTINLRTGAYVRSPRYELEYPYKVVVVDEVSMLSKELWDLLVKHDVYILALGDPGQLGPVSSDEDSGLLKAPHIFLDEIVRQAADNEIIKFSMQIRQGLPLTDYQGSNVQVVGPGDLTTGMLTWANQVLCAKNATRHGLNKQMRALEDRGPEPEIGDKVICLKNYWETFSEQEIDPLVNGTIGWITDYTKYFDNTAQCDVARISIETELGDTYYDLNADYKMLTENKSSLTKADFLKLYRKNKKHAIPKEFVFGSAITTWKAQGSEWDKILLFEENFPFIPAEHIRYLYTGVTRAADKIVIVRK